MEMNKKIQKPKLRKRKTRKEREEIIRSRMGLKFLNSKELKLLKDTFKKLDGNESGYIDKEEFEQAISSWGCHFDTGKTLEFFAYVDKNGSKRIDFDEFLDFFSSEINITEESLRQVFSTFIGDEKGDCLTIEHLKKLNSVYSEDELKELIDATDRTHSGKVSFEDFYKMITTKV